MYHKFVEDYMSPPNFNFDAENDDGPFISDETQDFNADKEAQKLIEWVEDYSKNYATPHLMMLMGGDFWYQNAF
jgi:hypothetical protein